VIRDLYATAEGPLVAIAMGEHGAPSRHLAGVWGAAFTFARHEGSAGSAPGQPTVRELLDVYRLRAQKPSTAIYGIVGSPVAHSLSPQIHNAAFAHLEVDAVYARFRTEDVAAFWRACGGWISGLSVTLPHKQALLSLMDAAEPLVTDCGAMNTVYREDSRVVAANTDAIAITQCLEESVGSLAGRRVLVLGAGGVARALAFACARRGAEVAITNRTAARAEELARACGGVALDGDAARAWPYDILANGTAVGMGKPDESPWPADAHRPGTVVFDTVYTPLETRLLRDAEQAGATTICGVEMFIDQAVAQCERWTKLPAPEHLMRRVVLARLGAG
jgi:3-dehydroquinate dehydratase/shikimate dehydrogenase